MGRLDARPVRTGGYGRAQLRSSPHEIRDASFATSEQRSRLLAYRPSPEPRSSRAGCCQTGAFLSTAFISLLTLLLLVKISLFDGPVNQSPNGSSVAFRRPDTDYILEAGWDFDAPPTVREYNWTIKDIVANPDGVFRRMITINGKFPGELIRCNEGDTIVVNVDNQSINATSVHWHGIFQNGTNWMDGTPGVSQCPIAPGRKFRYEFTVEGQAGTYFYHGHQAAQAADGLVGPLVIHSPEEAVHQKIPYATDRVVMLQDWYHDLSSGLLKEKLSPGSESSPVPNGALINGANVLDCALHTNRRCDSTSLRLPSFELTPNSHHRLRLLNVGAYAWFEVTVDDHQTLPITEIDGVNVEPSPEASVLIGPGQRYSVILPTNETKADAFWMRARIATHCFGENVLPDQGVAEAKAIIRYTLNASTETDRESAMPTTENKSGVFATACKDMNTRQYYPVPRKSAPQYAHHSWYLRVNLEIGDWRLQRGFLNASTYRPNLKSPTLHRVIEGLKSKNESFQGEGVNSKAFDIGTELVISQREVEVVDLVLQNFDEESHPFHLHGQQMFVLASGHGYFPGYKMLGLAAEGKGLLDPSNSSIIDNPVRRDVATVEGFGWVLIRFVADNPGPWLFHCHMAWHGESGMAMQFLSRLDMLQSWHLPQESLELCNAGIEELEKGAAPPDSTWYGKVG